jgi:hypothetical protein
MAQCMAMGEAAGTAAAMSVESNVTPGSLDVGTLRDRLVKNGVLL